MHINSGQEPIEKRTMLSGSISYNYSSNIHEHQVKVGYGNDVITNLISYDIYYYVQTKELILTIVIDTYHSVRKGNLTAILGNSLAQCDFDHSGPTVMQSPTRGLSWKERNYM